MGQESVESGEPSPINSPLVQDSPLHITANEGVLIEHVGEVSSHEHHESIPTSLAGCKKNLKL